MKNENCSALLFIHKFSFPNLAYSACNLKEFKLYQPKTNKNISSLVDRLYNGKISDNLISMFGVSN